MFLFPIPCVGLQDVQPLCCRSRLVKCSYLYNGSPYTVGGYINVYRGGTSSLKVVRLQSTCISFDAIVPMRYVIMTDRLYLVSYYACNVIINIQL